MRISDWSSDVCSSDLGHFRSGSPCPDHPECEAGGLVYRGTRVIVRRSYREGRELSSNTNADFPRLRVPRYTAFGGTRHERRSEEHTSELQSLMRTSYAVFCLKKKTDDSPIIIHK